MFCPKCGDKIEPNELYCNKCGNLLGNKYGDLSSTNESNVPNNKIYNYHQVTSNNVTNGKNILIGVGAGVGFLVFVFICTFIIGSGKEKYYFSANNQDNTEEIVQSPTISNTTTKKGKYSTVIITDNTYSGVKISTNKDAYNLIVKDSVNQKYNCPSEIKDIEDKIINKYGITAVNLCEMDVDFAKEISNVFGKIYEEYPSVRGYLTNISLINASLSDGYIAAFMPVFNLIGKFF